MSNGSILWKDNGNCQKESKIFGLQVYLLIPVNCGSYQKCTLFTMMNKKSFIHPKGKLVYDEEEVRKKNKTKPNKRWLQWTSKQFQTLSLTVLQRTWHLLAIMSCLEQLFCMFCETGPLVQNSNTQMWFCKCGLPVTINFKKI